MRAKELRKILKGLGCEEVSQSGSHLKVRCGKCFTTVAVGGDIPKGTLAKIRRDLKDCLGEDWRP